MSLLPRGLALVVFSAGALLVPSSHPIPVSTPVEGGPPVSRGVKYTPLDKEFYLAADQVGYVRPGLKIGIVGITNVAPGKKPVAEITISDSLDQPVDRLGAVTPGPVTPGFVLASWDADKRQYFAYTTRIRNGATNPSTDQSGTWTDLELGHSKYTFGTTLPADFDVTKMLTLGVQASRVMPAEVLDGKTYYADNVFRDFRADGGPATPVWNAINTDTACNNCHNPLAMHGGTRRSVRLCVLCHQPQHTLSETGESFDLKVMIHRIHRGENLPSVKAGKPFILTGTNDYSTVAFPQDIRNCYYCHEGTDPAKKPVQAANWYTYPSSKACGSCHDDVNFTTGVGHAAGPQADGTCASCHLPQGDAEWDASVIGAHTVPDKSKQLKGLKAEIISVDQAAPGKKPVVTFKVTNGDGTILDPKPFGTNLNIVLGGPTSDYTLFPAFRERADGATFNGTVGTYTFTNAIPAGASGTWTFSIEARRTVTLNPAPAAGPATYSEGASNPIKYVAVTGGAAKPRRTLVSLDKCNKCHNRLASLFSHGGSRIAIELCVICHNPNHSDVARRPASEGKPESGAFKRMIHRIHTGEDLTQDYTIYGFAGPSNFNEVRFPGDRRDCLTCHVNTAAYTLPVSPDAVPVVTQRDFFSPQGPGTAACVGCHDNRDVAAHAYLNTVNFPGASGPTEACGTCHGTGGEWAVEKVHAR
jgi:OmcA/MtrC family decaheme c-type cytochrome